MKEKPTQIKPQLDAKLEYYYGFGMGRYAEVLEELRIHGRVNSYRTSSIPLAEFWQPENLETLTQRLAPRLPGLDCHRALKFFEFPTEPVTNGKLLGRASMTDLMLMDGGYQIAIEAKYTEYSRMPNETGEEWMRKPGAVFHTRRHVAKCWLRYIQEAGCTDLRGTQRVYDTLGGISYQFLHRTASACFKTNGPEGHKPVLIYQLFFDANDPVSREDRVAFEMELKKWAEMLRLKNMKFLIMSVPIINAAEVKANYSGLKDEIFEEMKMHTIYKFDFDNITIEEVL